MLIMKVVLVEPPLLFAQTVKVVGGKVVDAKPLIWPLLKVMPAGSTGLMVQETGAPPDHVGKRVTVSTFQT